MSGKKSTVDVKSPGEYDRGSSYQHTSPPTGFVQPEPMAPPPYSAEVDPKPSGGDLKGDEESRKDVHMGELRLSDCTDASLRAAFMFKVYALLFFQLLITFGIVAVLSFVDEIKNYVGGLGKYAQSDGWWVLLIVALSVYITVFIIIILSTTVRRKVPYNYIFVTIFSLATGYMLGTVASLCNTMAVVEAMGATLAICVLMSLFGCQEKIPLGTIFIATFSLGISLMTFGILAIFTQNTWTTTICATLGVAFFSVVLLIDTWLIMSSGRHEVLMEEYVFCSLILYLDIIYIFIYLLKLLAESTRK